MSKIKNGGLDQYGTGPFEQQQFGTAGVQRVNTQLAIVFRRCCMLCATVTITKLDRQTIADHTSEIRVDC